MRSSTQAPFATRDALAKLFGLAVEQVRVRAAPLGGGFGGKMMIVEPLAGDTVHYEWSHGLGEVVTALAQTGLTVENLTETHLLPWPRWPQMVRTDNGWWEMPRGEPRFPLLYGLKATKS